VNNGAGTLAIYDRTEHESALYALPTKMHLKFNPGAEAAFANAATKKDNAFKVELGKRTVVRALELAGGAT